MPRYLALLRGINVGGRNKVAMADLREIAASLGHTEVATYIQSGNLVFTSKKSPEATLARQLEKAIATRLDVSPAVVVLSAAGLAEAIAANPFPDVAKANPRYLHAVFRQEDFTADGLDAIDAARKRAGDKIGRDEAVVVGRTMYLSTPDGFGRSELAVQLGRSKAQASGTARNWATVTKLMGMLADAG
jgi:uncharacterized protein (DUF1697 family)